MAPITPPPDDWHPRKGFEILTKYKNAIRQLYIYGKVSICALQIRYRDLATQKPLGYTTIKKILGYPAPERQCPNRTGPKFLLSNKEVDEVIIYCAQSWEYRILQYLKFREELGLKCSVQTLEYRLNQRGYYYCIACQKPYLTIEQVKARYL